MRTTIILSILLALPVWGCSHHTQDWKEACENQDEICFEFDTLSIETQRRVSDRALDTCGNTGIRDWDCPCFIPASFSSDMATFCLEQRPQTVLLQQERNENSAHHRTLRIQARNR